jgi:hypothetical protein
MNKPPIFRLGDSILGLFGLAGIGIATYIQLKADPGTRIEAFVITWIVAALLTMLWPVRIWIRWNFNKGIDFVTVHRICVFRNGYNVTKRECERVIEDMLAKWPNVLEDGVDHKYVKVYRALSEDYNFVRFEEGPYLDHERMSGAKVKFAGLTSGRSSRVAFKEADTPVESTAFAHEMGHIAFGALNGNNWGLNEEFHGFSKKYRLGV